ncbi:MAG: ABC transporter ATP-binding protein [Pseudomonadota bacterium]
MLSVNALDAAYGQAQVIFGLTLEAADGEVVALLGRNGAGKSTTLKAIMGLVSARAGQIRYDGREITQRTPAENARDGLGYVPEERRIFKALTVAENLEVGRQAARPDAPAWTPERLHQLFPNLAALGARPGGAISGGEQQMLALARTLMGNPRLLLLDEPSEGLAPVIVAQMADAIRKLKASGLTVVLSEQNLPFASAVADRAYVLERGQVALSGAMAELAGDPATLRRYLAV